jgi:curved DNA-binding protein CbpA
MEHTGDLYRILQVDPTADEIVIRAAYRALARCFHPDGGRPDAARMADLNRAYAVLRDPDARRQYDVRRSMARAEPIRVTDAGGRTDAWMPRRPADDHVVLDFGRYAGWSVRDLARHDPDYLRWLCRHSSGLRFREAIARVLPREPDLQRRANSVA